MFAEFFFNELWLFAYLIIKLKFVQTINLLLTLYFLLFPYFFLYIKRLAFNLISKKNVVLFISVLCKGRRRALYERGSLTISKNHSQDIYVKVENPIDILSISLTFNLCAYLKWILNYIFISFSPVKDHKQMTVMVELFYFVVQNPRQGKGNKYSN